MREFNGSHAIPSLEDWMQENWMNSWFDADYGHASEMGWHVFFCKNDQYIPEETMYHVGFFSLYTSESGYKHLAEYETEEAYRESMRECELEEIKFWDEQEDELRE